MTNQNDTDPQSPRARASRTDPGLGTASAAAFAPAPRPLSQPEIRDASGARGASGATGAALYSARRVPDGAGLPESAAANGRGGTLPFDGAPPRVKPLTPVPASTSIDTLLDGITGPRPAQPKTSESHSAAVAPFSPGPLWRAAAVDESSVPTPPPPSLARARISRRPDGSIRPVVQRTHDTTVFTARRALLRNGAAVLLSAAVVALFLFGFVHWSDTHRRAASASEGVSAAPPAESSISPVSPIAPVEPAVATTASEGVAFDVAPKAVAVVALPRLASTSSAAAGAPAAAQAHGIGEGKRAPAKVGAPGAKSVVHASDDLDDLNRQIRH